MNQTARFEDGEQRRGDLSVTRDGFRWTCPFCGFSRLKPAGEASGEQNAVTALRSHVLASVSDEHGPINAYPAAFDPATLSDHVVHEGGR